MKILQLNNKVPWPPKDGGAIGVLNFTRGFSALGHEVTLLAMNTRKHYCPPDSLPEEITRKARIITVDVDARVKPSGVLFNFLLSRIPYTASRFIDNRFRKRLVELLESEVFDVVQLEGVYLAPYLPDIRKYSRALVSMRAHNIEHEIWQRISYNSRNALKRLYFSNLAERIRRFEQMHLNRYDVILPISDRDYQLLVRMGLQIPHHLIPAGIDMGGLAVDHERMEFPAVFHLGALDWAPNQEGLEWFLSKVWPEVRRELPGLEFRVAGRNPPEHMVRMLQTEGVVYCGEVEDAHDFIRRGAIMVVPLLSGGGMRIKILEGMALGKSIVSTSVGTEGIHTIHMKNILIADTPEEFAGAVIRLARNRDLCLDLGREARHLVEAGYDNLSLIEKLAEFYLGMVRR
ncbi:MAG: glycosyltransferase [Bacteroidales bacterium]|nr:glycosyltransferase [Bacteroidales bacterium]